MFNKTSALILLIILSGCVSTKNIPIDPDRVSKNKPETILITNRDKPDFAAETAGKAMFAMFGVAAMISAGNEIVRKNSIEDPAHLIGSELISDLSKKYHLKIIDSEEVVDSSKKDKILGIYHDSDWILDIETINWSIGYFPSDWDNYHVIYSAKLRLFDSRSKSLIAEGFCSRAPDQNESSPTYNQLLENNAEIIKSELNIAARYCINVFKLKVLNLK